VVDVDARSVLNAAALLLRGKGVPDPRLDAELLLAEALGVPRRRLVAEPNLPVPPEARARFEAMLARRAAREPLQYILGRQEFWSIEYPVDPRVLIPRPETEHVVEAVLEAAARFGPAPLCVDMGTGCGTIAVALARELPAARIVAVDVSADAAACARETLDHHGLAERVAVLAADLFSAFGPGFRADIVASNPPYIDRAELDSLQEEVARHEPRLALDGGPGGLEVVGRLLDGAAAHLNPGGVLVFEAGSGQKGRIGEMAAASGRWRSHRVIDDYAGHDRVHVMERA
jgi:release factor glutamine methyltransferase